MSEEVSNSQILQAITELSDQVQELKGQFKRTEERLTKKIDKLDAKVTVLSEGLLDTQADVKILKNAKRIKWLREGQKRVIQWLLPFGKESKF